MLTAHRPRRAHEALSLAAVLIALGVHGVVLAAVHVLGLSVVGGGIGRHASRSVAPDVADDEDELRASCLDNALLAASARAAMCMAPWVRDVDHCLSGAQLGLWMDRSACQARNDPPATEVSMLDAKTADRLTPIDPERLLDEMKPQEVKQQPPPPPALQMPASAPPPPPPPPQPPLSQQVIETVKPSEEKEPENARFLAEYNTKVDKQTVSRGARNEPMVAKAKPEELTPKDKPRDEPSIKQAQPDRPAGRNERAPDVPGKLSMRNPGSLAPSRTEQEAKTRGSVTGASGMTTADGYAARRGDASLEQERHERSEIPRGQGGAGGGAPEVPNLKPTDEVLERALGGGSVDRLEDVDNGDETSLSAKRWVYASFFNRLKRQVAQNWDPNTVWRHADPTGTKYGARTRITEVRVSLSPRGELTKILVITPSGSAELDEEAVRAFRVAAPFPNPPDGLVQKDNLITFGFSFAFELGSQQRLSWRLPQAM